MTTTAVVFGGRVEYRIFNAGKQQEVASNKKESSKIKLCPCNIQIRETHKVFTNKAKFKHKPRCEITKPSQQLFSRSATNNEKEGHASKQIDRQEGGRALLAGF